MGIGTSLGAYFDDDLHHQAGINTDPSMDKNEVGPDESIAPRPGKILKVSDQSTSAAADASEEAGKLPPRDDAAAGVPAPLSAWQNIADSLFGTKDKERYQTWPERGLRDALDSFHKLATGEVPGYQVNPDTGETEIPLEYMEHLWNIVPFAASGSIPMKVRLREPELPTHDAAPTLADLNPEEHARLMRQPSNIEAAPTEHMPDETFYQHGLRQEPGTMSPAEEDRWAEIDRRPVPDSQTHPIFEQAHQDAVQSYARELRSIEDDHAAAGEHWVPPGIRPGESFEDYADRGLRSGTALNLDFVQRPYNPAQSHTEEDLITWLDHQQREGERVREMFDDNPNVIKKGGISVLKQAKAYGSGGHNFQFMNDQGRVGEMSLYEQDSGRNLHVGYIGTLNSPGPRDIGHSEIRSLLGILKDTFPKAQTITGFRVSGVRQIAGSGPMNARMRLRKPSE